MTGRRILVLRLSALGDFVISTGPFKSIRRHHAGDVITLLTTPPYAALGRSCPYFDRVLVTERLGFADLRGWIALVRTLRAERFDRVYDFHQRQRTNLLFRLLSFGRSGEFEWSGDARGARFRVNNAEPRRAALHAWDKQADQLRAAGIQEIDRPDLSWLDGDLAAFGVAPQPVLLVPGASPGRPAKRWPAESFADLALALTSSGVPVVILGGHGERVVAATISARAPTALDLTGRTDFGQLAALGRRARLAIGNDTGPMHVLAAAGAPSLVLYSADSDPDKTRPMGPNPNAVEILHRARLADLPVADVLAAALRILGTSV